nr:MAG TPA: hypothetical protein [Caudoviricetes sp.]
MVRLSWQKWMGAEMLLFFCLRQRLSNPFTLPRYIEGRWRNAEKTKETV